MFNFSVLYYYLNILALKFSPSPTHTHTHSHINVAPVLLLYAPDGGVYYMCNIGVKRIYNRLSIVGR